MGCGTKSCLGDALMYVVYRASVCATLVLNASMGCDITDLVSNRKCNRVDDLNANNPSIGMD